MGNEAIKKLRAEALALPEHERAELALELVRSLDGDVEPDVIAAWDQELQRRLSCVREGTAVLVDRDELRQRLEAQLRRS